MEKTIIVNDKDVKRNVIEYNKMKELYETNLDFKSYVDKYITKHNLELWEALCSCVVMDYAEYLINDKQTEIEIKQHEYDTEINKDLGILGC